MSWTDFVLPLGYLALFLWIIQKLPVFRTSGLSIRVLQFAFILRVISGFVVYWIYTFYYPVRMEADTYKYFDDSRFLYDALHHKPVDFFKMLFGIDCENKYFFDTYYTKMFNWYRSYDNGLLNDNRLVIRFNAVIRLFSAGNYHIHSLFFNFFAFLGSFYMARVFMAVSQSKWRTYFSIFLIPSFIFWSSGILKESILILALGIFCWNFYKLMNGQNSIGLWLSLPFLTSILLVMKLYVFIAFLPALIGWWLSKKTRRTILIHVITALSLLLLAIIWGYFVPQLNFVHILVDKQHDFINLANTFQVNSKIDIPSLDYSLFSFVKATPQALINSLTRPWPNELKSILFIPAFLENILIIFILGASVFYRKKVSPQQWKFVIFALAFSLFLLIIIGLTTPILGAIVRYKIPALPFLILVALLFLDVQKLPSFLIQSKWIKWINTQL